MQIMYSERHIQNTIKEGGRKLGRDGGFVSGLDGGGAFMAYSHFRTHQVV